MNLRAIALAWLAVGTLGGRIVATNPDRALSAGVASHSTACPLTLANRAGAPSASKQLITVVALTPSSTTAVVERWRRSGQCFVAASGTSVAFLGRSGLSSHHHEGDGTTPVGVFGFGAVMYGTLANPGVAYRWHRLACGDWWDEDPQSPQYNHFVALRCGVRPPFGGDSEALWTELPAYDAFALIDYNTDPVIAGRGSAIFLHLSTNTPTDGCVALPRAALLRTLRWMRPSEHPVIAIGTRAELTTARRS